MTNLVCINADIGANARASELENSVLSEVDDSLLAELREADRRITENSRKLNKLSMEIGWDGYFIKRQMGWWALGYEGESHYRRAKDIGRSTWFKVVGIAEGLSHLSREDFLGMTIENAALLAEQPMHMKQDAALILKAQTETSERFADSLVRHVAVRDHKPVEDLPVIIKLHVRQSQRKVIERGLEEWEYAHGIDDPGYALELMIAEFSQKLTLVGFISEAIMRLSRAVAAAHTPEELEDLRQLFAAHLKDMDELLKISSGEVGTEQAAA